MVESLTTLKSETAVPLKATVVVPVNPVPEMVIGVPPARGPELGKTPVTGAGGGAMPPAVVSMRLPMAMPSEAVGQAIPARVTPVGTVAGAVQLVPSHLFDDASRGGGPTLEIGGTRVVADCRADRERSAGDSIQLVDVEGLRRVVRAEARHDRPGRAVPLLDQGHALFGAQPRRPVLAGKDRGASRPAQGAGLLQCVCGGGPGPQGPGATRVPLCYADLDRPGASVTRASLCLQRPQRRREITKCTNLGKLPAISSFTVNGCRPKL
jgi:hypothetical protein